MMRHNISMTLPVRRPFGVAHDVGVNEYIQLKRAALLFECVYVAGEFDSDEVRPHPMPRDVLRTRRSDLKALWNSGVLRYPDQSSVEKAHLECPEDVHPFDPRWLQLLAATISHDSDIDAIPLLRSYPAPTSDDAARATAFRAVLEHLPLPALDTPVEAILDWRSDLEATEKYARLRAWINKIARSRLTGPDVFDEVASLVSEYSSYMALQHKKMSRGRLEMVIVTTAEVIESVVRLRLSSALKKLFDLQQENLRLKESEFSAPGREVAYVAGAQDRFGAPGSIGGERMS